MQNQQKLYYLLRTASLLVRSIYAINKTVTFTSRVYTLSTTTLEFVRPTRRRQESFKKIILILFDNHLTIHTTVSFVTAIGTIRISITLSTFVNTVSVDALKLVGLARFYIVKEFIEEVSGHNNNVGCRKVMALTTIL